VCSIVHFTLCAASSFSSIFPLWNLCVCHCRCSQWGTVSIWSELTSLTSIYYITMWCILSIVLQVHTLLWLSLVFCPDIWLHNIKYIYVSHKWHILTHTSNIQKPHMSTYMWHACAWYVSYKCHITDIHGCIYVSHKWRMFAHIKPIYVPCMCHIRYIYFDIYVPHNLKYMATYM